MNGKLKDILSGKTFSVLGDSISTYEGVSNDNQRQRALVSNPSFYRFPFPLEGMYWYRLQEHGLRLCVNNSWSGAFLTRHFPGVGTDRKKTLSPGIKRVAYLMDNDGKLPDVILVFMGMNDLGYGVDADIFADAYEYVVRKIQTLYPQATTFCVGLPNREEALRERAEKYNQAIRRAVSLGGERFVYVDLFESGLCAETYREKSLEGLHPNEQGMQEIADVLERTMVEYYCKENI